jgi:Ser/Thr protein kinase RdoA (MazF antagonist)
MTDNLLSICNRFQTAHPIVSFTRIDRGHINDSYYLMNDPAGPPTYVLQRINHHVFRNVEGLMSNIAKVLAHLEGRIRCSGKTGFVPLHLIPTHGGELCFRDPDGNFWRMYNYIPGSRSFDGAGDPETAREAGRAFGIFQELTLDLDGSSLIETIPDFHNISTRLRTFRKTVEMDPAGRVAETRKEIRFAEERADEMHAILNLGAAGKIPLRVTHNDTKINNVLFDSKGKAVCIVDLDTVMPGYSLYDFGDAIRTGASAAPEDEEDLSKVSIRMDLFSAYSEGYLSVANKFLLPDEKALLAFSARFMTYLIGLRFLTDYIDGDHYYRIRHAKHNLVRARSQFRLVESMEEQSEQMEKIISTVALKKI